MVTHPKASAQTPAEDQPFGGLSATPFGPNAQPFGPMKFGINLGKKKKKLHRQAGQGPESSEGSDEESSSVLCRLCARETPLYFY